LYARLTARQLYIDWTTPLSDDRMNTFPHLFSRPQLADPSPIWDSESVAPAVWTGHLHECVDELMPRYETDVDADCVPAIQKKYTIDVARVDYSEEVLVRWAWTDELYRMRRHLRGSFAALGKLNDMTLLRKLLHDELALAPTLQACVDDFHSSQFAEVNIGLHIRHSDRQNSYEQYPRVVDQILRKNPSANIFLATDNHNVEEEFRRRYPRLTVRQKWFATPGIPLHRTRSCPDRLALAMDALAEMWLLGKCEYLVYNSSSTFGLLASLISTAPEQNLVDTIPWRLYGRNWLAQRFKEQRLQFGR
jgi:hypothetical protein